MKKFLAFLATKGHTNDTFLALEAVKQGELYNEFIDSVANDVEGKASKDDLSTLKTELKDFLGGEIAKQIQENSTAKLSNVEKFKLRKMVEEKHDEIIEAIKNRKEFTLEFKAAAMHMTNNGTVSNGTVDFPSTDNFAIDNELAVIRYPENFILTVIPNRLVERVPQTRIKKEQAPKEGAVAVVAEGAVKPLQQYKWVRTATDRVKYAGRIEWTEEFEMDFEALFLEILNLFEADVLRKWNNGIIDIILAEGSSYVSSTLDGTLVAPDNGLAVVAAQSQIQSLNYNPDITLFNPADLVATMFQQDTEGNLKLHPYINVATGTINGMRMIANNTIPQGTAVVMDSTTWREEHSNFMLRTGQYNAQLIENEYTAIGEVFSILSVATIDLVGTVVVDLDAVKTALLKTT